MMYYLFRELSETLSLYQPWKTKVIELHSWMAKFLHGQRNQISRQLKSLEFVMDIFIDFALFLLKPYVMIHQVLVRFGIED